MEVEYIAYSKTTCQAIWLRNLIYGMYIMDTISRPLTIHCDNIFVVYFSQSQRKHFHVKLLFIIEKINNSQARIVHISTKHILADSLTKGLPVGVFRNYVTHTGLVKSFDEAWV